jgi:hypothetical protein
MVKLVSLSMALVLALIIEGAGKELEEFSDYFFMSTGDVFTLPPKIEQSGTES